MKPNSNTLSADGHSQHSILISMVSFLIAFVVQMLFIYKWNLFRYYDEEFSIMAMGAHYAGYKWDKLCVFVSYGGVFYIPFYKLLFNLGVNGKVVYRVMRWGIAVLNSVPAYIVSGISHKHYRLNAYASVGLGLIATFMSVSRASSVRPVSILVVLMWMLIYLFISYHHAGTGLKSVICSVAAGVVLAFMLFVNINAVVLLPAIIIVITLIRLSKRKWMVNVWAFVPSFVLVAGLLNYVFDRVLLDYTGGKIWETTWTAEVYKYVRSIGYGVKCLLLPHGIRGFVDLFISNIWTIALFSFGIVIYAFIRAMYAVKYDIEQNAFELGIILFLGVGTLLSVAAISFSEITSGMYIHLIDAAPDNNLFCLNSYGYLICPMMILELLILHKQKDDKTRCMDASIIIILYSSLFVVFSVVIPAVLDGNVSMRWWFGYETSFLVILSQMANEDTAIFAIFIPTVIVVIMMLCYSKTRDYRTLLSLLLLISFVQYVFVEDYWADKNIYTDRFDSFVEYTSNGPLSQVDISDVYVYEDISIAYAMQLSLPNLTIHHGEPGKYDRNAVILTDLRPSDVWSYCGLNSSYKAVTLDDNEYLITNDQEIINALSESLLVYNADSLVFDYVTFIYQNTLGRDPDLEGLMAWSGLLINGDIEPSDVVIGLLTSDEISNRGYSNEQMAAAMVYAFLYYPGDSELIPVIAARLENGETVDEAAADLINSDRYSEVLGTFRLHDSNADRVNSIVNRAYECVLGRSADANGLSEFGDMIRNHEITPDDLLELLINSEEYLDNDRSAKYTIIRLYYYYNNSMPDMDMVRDYAEMIESGEISYRNLEERWSESITYHKLLMVYNMSEYI